MRYGVAGRAAMVLFLFVGAHFSVIGAAWGATAGSVLLWFLYTVFAVPRAGVRIGPITVDSIRVLVLYAIAFAVTQGVIRSSPHIGPPPVELLVGLGVMATCLAAGAACVPAIRRDVLQIISTLRLLRARRTDAAGGVDREQDGPPQAGPGDNAPSREGEMDRARVEEIAEAGVASPSGERSLAVDVQRRGGDTVP